MAKDNRGGIRLASPDLLATEDSRTAEFGEYSDSH